MNYSWTVPIAMFGFVPFTLFLFGWLGPKRAVVLAYMLGFMFLPVAWYKVEGLPEWDKTVAINVSVLIAVAAFDLRRIVQFRPSWLDLPMLCWCFGQMVTSLLNDLGYWDGQSQTVAQILWCGIPYFLGRLYLGSADDLRKFVVAFLLGALVYVPLCVFELKMSPQLHAMVYGFHSSAFLQTLRLGGWRPTVFLGHGISVGLFMCAAALAGVWIWRTKCIRRIWGMPVGFIALTVFVVAIACKSTGAIALLLLALAVLWTSRIAKSRWPLLALVLIAPVYMLARANSFDLGSKLVEIARAVAGDRADSLAWRMDSERTLALHALERPLFGWGTWGRNLVEGFTGGPSTPDSRWIIYFGVSGFFGLASWTAAVLLPAYIAFRRVPRGLLLSPGFAPVVIAIVIEVLYVLDSLLNSEQSPVYLLLAGGLASFAVSVQRVGRQSAVPPRRPGPAAARDPEIQRAPAEGIA